MGFGAMKGLGIGLQKTADDIGERLKEERLRAYQDKTRKEEWGREDSKTVTDRTYEQEEDKNFLVGRNASGDVVAREEQKSEPLDAWRVDKFGRRYNTYTGTMSDDPILNKDGNKGGSQAASKQLDAAKETVANLKEKVEFGQASPQETRTYNEARNFIVSFYDGKNKHPIDLSDVTPEMMADARAKAKERVKGMGGVMGFGSDFAPFSSANEAEEYYYQQHLSESKGEPFNVSPRQFMAQKGDGGDNRGENVSESADARRAALIDKVRAAEKEGATSKEQEKGDGKGKISAKDAKGLLKKSASPWSSDKENKAGAIGALQDIRKLIDEGVNMKDPWVKFTLRRIYSDTNLPKEIRNQAFGMDQEINSGVNPVTAMQQFQQ